jgi:hypothetical protein
VQLTEQQPLNNIVRVAYQAMAAVLGGCQSLHTDSMDETLGLPTEQAVTVALRTQQILAHETGVTRVVDPLGGSWFIEQLTDTMEREALNFIHEVDSMGEYADWKAAKRAGRMTRRRRSRSLGMWRISRAGRMASRWLRALIAGISVRGADRGGVALSLQRPRVRGGFKTGSSWALDNIRDVSQGRPPGFHAAGGRVDRDTAGPEG